MLGAIFLSSIRTVLDLVFKVVEIVEFRLVTLITKRGYRRERIRKRLIFFNYIVDLS